MSWGEVDLADCVQCVKCGVQTETGGVRRGDASRVSKERRLSHNVVRGGGGGGEKGGVVGGKKEVREGKK